MTKKLYSRREVMRTTAGAMGVGLLAACAAPMAPAGGEAAIPSEQRQGVLWGLQYDPHVEAYQRLADLFESQGGGTYEVQPQAWPIPPKVIAALAAGTQPDVACIMGEQLTSLHLHQALVPCTEQVYNHMGVDPDESFVGDAIGAYTWQGEIWGVPTEANGVGNMVNVPSEDVIALGLEDQYPPLNGEVFFESYPSMWELAQALQVEEDGKVTKWGLSSQGWDDMSYLGILRGCSPEKGRRWSDRDFMPSLTEEAGTESEHGLSTVSGPAHASLFHTLLNQGFGSRFDGAAADREASLAIGSVVHASLVFPQIGDRLFDFWRRLCGVGIETQDAAEEQAQLTAS